jgi:hypothetical protein
MTSTLTRRTLGFKNSLLAATLCQGYPDIKQKIWNIASTERYILHVQVLMKC